MAIISPSEAVMTSASTSPRERVVTSAPVNLDKADVAPVLFYLKKNVSVRSCEGGVASHPSNRTIFFSMFFLMVNCLHNEESQTVVLNQIIDCFCLSFIFS